MKTLLAALALTCLIIFSTATVLTHLIFDDTIGPFNVNDISTSESDLQIATDLSIGKGSRILKALTVDKHIYTLFEVHPYEGDFGIASFAPINKIERFKFDSATYSKQPVQAKIIRGKKRSEVVVGVKKGSSLQKVVLTVGQQQAEIQIPDEHLLDIIRFSSLAKQSAVTITGYDRQGREQVRMTIQ